MFPSVESFSVCKIPGSEIEFKEQNWAYVSETVPRTIFRFATWRLYLFLIVPSPIFTTLMISLIVRLKLWMRAATNRAERTVHITHQSGY